MRARRAAARLAEVERQASCAPASPAANDQASVAAGSEAQRRTSHAECRRAGLTGGASRWSAMPPATSRLPSGPSSSRCSRRVAAGPAPACRRGSSGRASTTASRRAAPAGRARAQTAAPGEPGQSARSGRARTAGPRRTARSRSGPSSKPARRDGRRDPPGVPRQPGAAPPACAPARAPRLRAEPAGLVEQRQQLPLQRRRDPAPTALSSVVRRRSSAPISCWSCGR